MQSTWYMSMWMTVLPSMHSNKFCSWVDNFVICIQMIFLYIIIHNSGVLESKRLYIILVIFVKTILTHLYSLLKWCTDSGPWPKTGLFSALLPSKFWRNSLVHVDALCMNLPPAHSIIQHILVSKHITKSSKHSPYPTQWFSLCHEYGN